MNINENDSIPLVTSLAMSANDIPDSFEQYDGFPVITSISEEELNKNCRADPAIFEVFRQLESGETTPPAVRKELQELSVRAKET